MPIRSKQYCTKGGCSKFRTKGARCDDHQIESWQTSSSKTTTQRGYGHAWRNLRKTVIEINKGLCSTCRDKGIYKTGRDVDHIKPKAQGGTDALSNLTLLCSECHKQKTQSESGSARLKTDNLSLY